MLGLGRKTKKNTRSAATMHTACTFALYHHPHPMVWKKKRSFPRPHHTVYPSAALAAPLHIYIYTNPTKQDDHQ